MSRYAILSVWDKTDIVKLATALIEGGYRILTTGGTYKTIEQTLNEQQRRELVQVSEFTEFPEILGGRVKTLHPKIHAGILARDDQMNEMKELGLDKISIVVANLYPFTQTVQSGADEQTVLENIDIGGHSLIRAAAKNYQNTLVVTDPSDYPILINGLGEFDAFDISTRQSFAAKAFAHIAEYDIAISQYFGDTTVRKYHPVQKLKYGCNPHQQYAALCAINANTLPLKILNGNVGYINLIDALLGFQLVCEAADILGYAAAASYKHTSPAGVGIGVELSDEERLVFDVQDWDLSGAATAFIRARSCDPLSSFGDFISISHIVDASCAQLIKREVSDGIIAPGYTEQALETLKSKKGGNFTILQLPTEWCIQRHGNAEYREICGMALCQTRNDAFTLQSDLATRPTTLTQIPADRERDLILANITLKYTQSNSVAYSYGGQVIGIGAGQQNRVDCVKMAGKKAERWCARFTDQVLAVKKQFVGTRSEQNNAIYDYIDSQQWRTDVDLCLASDAFFPFPDSIQVAKGYGVKYILQPGGSVADNVCIEECNKDGVVMVMTGKRMFLH